MHRLKQHSAGSLWLAHTRQTGKHRRRCLRRRHPAAAAIAARYNFTHFRTMMVTITVEIREEREGGCRFVRVCFRVNRNISGKRGGQVWPGWQGHQNGAMESLRRTPNSMARSTVTLPPSKIRHPHARQCEAGGYSYKRVPSSPGVENEVRLHLEMQLQGAASESSMTPP